MSISESTKAMFPRTVGPKSGRLPTPDKTADDEFSSSVLDDNTVPDPPAPPVIDPARVAARLLVARLVTDLGEAEVARIRQPGTIVSVEVPGADWVELIAVAWREVILNLTEDGAIFTSGDSRPEHWDRLTEWGPQWVEFCRDGSDRQHRPDTGNTTVANAAIHGLPIYGFAPAPRRHLPSDLLRTADFHLIIRPLDRVTLAALAANVVGAESGITLDDADCAKLTPNDLRLAMRTGQTVEEYLKRLAALVEDGAKSAGLALSDLHGMDEAVQWGQALARDLKAYARGDLLWNDIDRGALLAGPPGVGKTTWARALALECGVPLVLGSFATWQTAGSGHLGDMLSAMRRCFDDAKRQAPCLLFIDELDSAGSREQFKGHNESYNRQTLNALLELLAGVDDREGVVVIGATNDASAIDPAIRRAGRLDRLIRVELPTPTALQAIFRVHLGPGNLPDADLKPIARMAVGYSGADVEKTVRGARRRARTAGRPMILDDLIVEIRGEGEKERNPNAWRIAIHEAAHAVGTVILRPGSLKGVTLRSIGDIAAATVAADDPLPTLSQMKTRMVVMLCGRAAERFFFDDISAGSGGDYSSDLARATLVALRSISAYRMHDEDPPTWLGDPKPEDVAQIFFMYPGLAKRVDRMMEDAERNAVELVDRYHREIEAVAILLLDHETLSGADVAAAIHLAHENNSVGMGV